MFLILQKMAKWSEAHNGKFPDPYAKLKLDDEDKERRREKKKKKKKKEKKAAALMQPIIGGGNSNNSNNSNKVSLNGTESPISAGSIWV